MFLRQLQLIVSALTCALATICAFLYQLPLLKIVGTLGLLWSIYACYKIFNYEFGNEKSSKTPKDKENLEIEYVGKKHIKIFSRSQELPNNSNKEANVIQKKEPIISKF